MPRAAAGAARRVWLGAATCFIATGSAAPASSQVSAPPPLSHATQLVVVTTAGWDSTTGELRRFTRDDPRSPWRPEGNAVPIVVGRTGLAWGVGFDRFAEGSEPHKLEGDGRSPAGVFPLDTAFGFAPADSMPWVRLRYLQLTSTTDCVDDTASMHYNEVLDRSAVARVDWQSAERMRQIGAYRLGVIIDFNTAPTTRARGSCVFFHIWGGPRSHTAGCTAMDAAELERLVAWLDPDARPVVVQLPAGVVPRVRGGWGLPELAVPAHGVIGVDAEHLHPEFWVRQQPSPDRLILTPAAIAEQNRVMLERDSSLYDLERLPAVLTRAQVRPWVERLSRAPGRQLFDERGDSVPAVQIAALVAAAQLDAVPVEQPLRFALVTARADLRTFPTRLRVFSSRDNTDIDRWQESALFPGTPAVIVHESRDGQWWFVVSQHYAAWVEKSRVAEGPRNAVLGYARKTPYLVVTGAKVRTVFTPERPDVSELQLDMGVRVPLLADWPADSLVNGQNAYTGHVIELPVRTAAGHLELVPALLAGNADVAADYLPLTAAGVLHQAFKFLGERYGWGHSYNGRDCSGFVAEVYRAFGVDLPRNTGDQADSPALNRIAFTDADDHERRLAVLREAQVGDLVYIPGHVMMVIGRVGDVTYVIHDVTGINYLGPDGEVVRVPLNGVSVSQLETLASSADRTWVDNIRSIQRVRP